MKWDITAGGKSADFASILGAQVDVARKANGNEGSGEVLDKLVGVGRAFAAAVPGRLVTLESKADNTGASFALKSYSDV